MPTRIVRIAPARYPIWDAGRALLKHGRWHPAGVAVIYAASSLALAMLELMVQESDYRVPRRRWVEASVPDDVTIEDAKPPDGWQNKLSASAMAYGREWLMSKRSAVLRVPSAVALTESNFLVNPGHPDFARIGVSEPQDVTWDTRLLSSALR